MKSASHLNRPCARRRAAVLLGAGMLACPAALRANTTYTWSGGNAGTGYWDVASNWGGTAPPTSGPSDLVFGSVNMHSPNQPYIEFNYNISSITFNSSALAYAMGTSNNNTVAVGSGGITDAASNAESLSMGLILSTSQTWNVGNSVGSLTLNGSLTNNSSSTLTKTGAGTLNLSLAGTTNSVAGLSLQGGLTQLTSGTLSALTSGLGVSSGTQLNVSGGAILNAGSASIDVVFAGGSVINVAGTGSQLNASLSGSQINVGDTNNGSFVNITSGGSISGTLFLFDMNGAITINSGGTMSVPVTVLGNSTGLTGAATISGSGSALNASSFVALGGDGAAGGTGKLLITNSGAVNTPLFQFESSTSSVNVSGGTLNAGALTSLNNGFGAITLADPTSGYALNINGTSGTQTYSGSITGTGTLNKSGGSTQILSGTLACGGVLVNGGLLQLSLATSSSNAIDHLSVTGGTAQLSSGSLSAASNNGSGLFVSSGTFNLSGGAKLTLFPSGFISALIETNGSALVTGSGTQLSCPNTSFESQINVGEFTGNGTLSVTNSGNVSSGFFVLVGGTQSGASGTLLISSSGSVTAPYPDFGYVAGTTGTGTVTGAGSILNATSNLELGGDSTGASYGGTGLLTISSGGSVNAAATTFYSNTSSINISGGTLITGGLNSNASGNGAITLTNPTSGTALTLNGSSGTYTYSGTFAGTGTLLKTGGSTQILSLSGSSALGSLSLQGGTTQLSSGTLTLSSGFGVSAATFNVSGGAVLNSAFPSIQAIDTGGSMTVTGSGSQWVGGGQVEVGVSGVGSLTVASGGSASVGTYLDLGESSGGNGTVSVTSGGTLSAPVTTIGFGSGSTGKLTVSGAGSVLNASAFVALGGDGSAGGTGTLIITNSGAVNTPSTDFESTTSSVNVSGGTLNTGALTSLNNGFGAITLADPTSGYALNINGTSGTNTYSGSITGTGTLNKSGGSTQILSGTLACGGVLVNSGVLQLSLATSSSNVIDHLSVTGGTALMNSGSLTAASNNSNGLYVTNGTVNISGGAKFTVATTLFYFPTIDANGVMLVTGAGSQLNTANNTAYVDQIDVGLNSGAASLAVTNQGSVSSEGFLLMGGFNSGASGALTISSSGSVTASNPAFGLMTGTTGTGTVTGSGSILTATSNLELGGEAAHAAYGGTGILTISSGGAVNAAETTFYSNTSSINISGGTLISGGLNSNASGNGAITLTNPTSGTALTLNGSSGTYTYSGTFAGTGTLLKTGGSTQTLSGGGTLGSIALQGGTTLISGGSLSVTSTTANPIFGVRSASTLNISGGATVNVPATNGVITTLIDGSSSATVTGMGSLLSTGFQIDVGYATPGTLTVSTSGSVSSGTFLEVGGPNGGSAAGTGTMTISSGGTVAAPVTVLGQTAGATGTATVTGAGSMLNASAFVALGGDGGVGGTGTLIITNSGVVNTPIVTFESPTSSINVSGGTLNAGYLTSLNNGFGSIALTNPAGGYALNINDTTAADSNIYSGTITGTGGLSKSGASTQILSNNNTFTGPVQVTGGTLALSGHNAFISAVVSAGTLMINGSGNVLSVPTLVITGSGTLDLTTDALDNSGGTLSSVNALVQQGYNGGRWNGSGITSSTAAADTRHLTAVGVIQNNQGGSPIYNSSHQFLSTTPGASDILAAYTYYGDTNLDGKVDGSDYSRIDVAFQADRTNPTADTGWYNGDFNYDGTVNGSDYTLIDNAFNTQGAQLSSQVADPSVSIASQLAATSAVPEPATLALLGIGSLAALSRRRRADR